MLRGKELFQLSNNQHPPIQTLTEFNIKGLKMAVEAFNNLYDYARIFFDIDNHFVSTAYFND